MSSYPEMLKNELNHNSTNLTLTQNGAPVYISAGSPLVDFSYSVNNLRNKTPEQIMALFERCYKDNPLLATKMMFQIGDVREGKGERRTFNTCLRYMAQAHPEIAKALLPLVPEYTRWDHVAEMAICGSPSVQRFARQFIADQLNKDFATVSLIEVDEQRREMLTKELEKATDEKERAAIEKKLEAIPQHRELSLCAKWTPALGAKKPGHHKIALKIAQTMGVDKATYRRMRSAITKHLNLLERQLSQKTLTADSLEHLTGANHLRAKKALERTLGEETYNEYLEKVETGEAKMNIGAVTPAEIVHRYTEDSPTRGYWDPMGVKAYDPTLEEMWARLPDIQGDDNNSIIVVRDDSGSMTSPVSKDTTMTCLEVATAFSIYCAERLKGPYKDQFLSFSERPKYMDISPFDSLHDKLSYCNEHSEVANTNIEATFDLLLNTAIRNHLTQDQIPSCVLIFSDMEFDMQTDGRTDIALFENLRERWDKAGYKMPVCAFWNLNSQRALVPSVDDRGVVLLSGFTKDNLDLLMSGELAKFTPERQLELVLNQERYNAVGEAFKEGLSAERVAQANSSRVAPSFAEYLPEEGYTRVRTADEEEYNEEYEGYDDDGYVGDDDGDRGDDD